MEFMEPSSQNDFLLVCNVRGEIGSILIFNWMTEGVLPALECQVSRLSLDVFARMHAESISGSLVVSQGRISKACRIALVVRP